jgi:hypothetical protein
MTSSLILFLVVFLLNIIPAFAPPTWMVFSFLGFRFPTQMAWTFALVGALGAASGRFLLGKLSRKIVRNHWLSDSARENVDSFKLQLQARPKFTFGLFLFYAFTPLPSNYLFIAYGLTTLPLVRLAFPFLIGRFVSYYLWSASAAAVSHKFDLDGAEALGYFSLYFVLTQITLLAAIYCFTRIDWKLLFHERKWRWLPKNQSRHQS